jgi:4-amino-4-deoxy-L-arabinose transferase-like glycosyltransferase
VSLSGRQPFAARLVLPVAALELVLQLAFANRYGYHRDELYFRTAARHPAAGYDDQGPLTPFLGLVSETLFGESPRGLRVLSAVIVAVVVVVVALLARELGAGAAGQLTAAAGTAVSAFVLAVGHLLSTSTVDLLVWTVSLLLVARILGGGSERLWLAVGVAVGVGLENKQLPLLLVFALAAGLALDRRLVGVLRSPWPWAGAVIALALWLPNLVWQGTHGWPQLELAEDIREDEAGESRATLVPLQLLLVGLPLVPVLGLGLWGLLRDAGLGAWRSLGFAYVALLVVLFAVGGKPYYAAPFLLCLLAAGAVVVERWLTTRARRAVLAGALALSAVLAVPVALPVLPADQLEGSPVAEVNEDAIETVGWPELARTVDEVYDALPARERSTAVVFAGNYGEAGAIDRYGPELGLPRAYSAHNAYARFGIPPGGAGPVVVLGYRDASVDFVGCRRAATVDNGVGLENEEQGGTVFVCERPREAWAELWPKLTHLDA